MSALQYRKLEPSISIKADKMSSYTSTTDAKNVLEIHITFKKYSRIFINETAECETTYS